MSVVSDADLALMGITRDEWDERRARYKADQEAAVAVTEHRFAELRRLADKLGLGRNRAQTDVIAATGEVLFELAFRRRNPGHQRNEVPALSGDDYVAALMQVEDAHRSIDYAAYQIIEAARRANVSWERIGVALGHPQKSARQAAINRWRKTAGKSAKPPTPGEDEDE